MRDLYSGLTEVMALAPADQAATVNGLTVDTRECAGVFIAVTTGVITAAGAFGAKLQESADGVTWADVAAKWAQGDAPATLLAASTYRLGYLGKLRFIRVVLTKTGGTSMFAAAVAILRPLSRPVA